jgi:anti-sigma-K factor RskA
MADCAQLAELYEAYALGALEGAELAAIEEHLARRCRACTAGVERARWVVANLSYAAAPAEPPAALRKRLLGAIAAEPGAASVRAAAPPVKTKEVESIAAHRMKPDAEAPSRTWIPAWAWAAAVILILFSGYTTWQMRQFQREVADLERQGATEKQRAAALDSERERYLQALNIMAAAATKRMQLKPGKTAMPPVNAYWNPAMGLVLSAEKMPNMPPDRTLQLWVVPKQGMPISVGIFRPNSDGQVMMVMPPAEAMNMAKALAISEEPAGGSPQPTSTPEWVGPVG